VLIFTFMPPRRQTSLGGGASLRSRSGRYSARPLQVSQLQANNLTLLIMVKLDSYKIFMECLNIASSKCWFSDKIPFEVVSFRLCLLREVGCALLDSVVLCRLHEALQQGCHCANESSFQNTFDEILAMKQGLVFNIKKQMSHWEEFIRYRAPNEPSFLCSSV
jgi:hypothetical protein